MKIETNCPHCGEIYEIEEKHAGQQVECLKCQNKFNIDFNMKDNEIDGYEQIADESCETDNIISNDSKPSEQSKQHNSKKLKLPPKIPIKTRPKTVVNPASKSTHKMDYLLERVTDNNKVDFWIELLKIFAWIHFIIIIIAGVIIGVSIASIMGAEWFFLYLIISLLIAFSSVAGSMVFLNLAKHVWEIRNMMKKQQTV